ncbi:hypothetical protein VBM87_01640 [Mycoplasma sp. 744]|uniref:MAG3450 family membrane protein n=1 Tax=Mycoplasma sp. 744 TaxID=3108531 RepID=UPI002B1E2359|nr:hypothetical protein [Mycoplasma sp. 744]MEA4115482.1 hypothetical protein [Mycoplasma sp. 744]
MNKSKYLALYNWLFLTFVCIIPQAIIYFLGSNDLGSSIFKSYVWLYIIFFSLLIISFIVQIILIKINFISIKTFTINIPISAVFTLMISLSQVNLELIYKLLLALLISIISALISNIIVHKIIKIQLINKKDKQ